MRLDEEVARLHLLKGGDPMSDNVGAYDGLARIRFANGDELDVNCRFTSRPTRNGLGHGEWYGEVRTPEARRMLHEVAVVLVLSQGQEGVVTVGAELPGVAYFRGQGAPPCSQHSL